MLRDAADAALWVGEIPDHVVAGGGRFASAHLRSLFAAFGEVVSVTVRTKPGVPFRSARATDFKHS